VAPLVFGNVLRPRWNVGRWQHKSSHRCLHLVHCSCKVRSEILNWNLVHVIFLFSIQLKDDSMNCYKYKLFVEEWWHWQSQWQQNPNYTNLQGVFNDCHKEHARAILAAF
jgi:hypothetical protein